MNLHLKNIYQLLDENKRILITGGAGFIGGALIRRLIQKTNVKIFNLDKLGYASSLDSINEEIRKLGIEDHQRYKTLKVDLANQLQTEEAIFESDPDLIFHLAAESHVDRSIKYPKDFINSNVVGTFNLLISARNHFERIPSIRKNFFRLHHVSTDEVFGSLGENGYFNESTNYDPKSPYSASKAASDHLVSAWENTYNLPVSLTNCSNNYGPWQYPEKLIPTVILNAISNKSIPLYGSGNNIRDWLHVDDHIDALLLSAIIGKVGNKYCIGGDQEKTNKEIVIMICDYLDNIFKKDLSYKELIKQVEDRPGHDFRYSIDSSLIKRDLDWEPKTNFNIGLENTINWYLKNESWCLSQLVSNI